MRKNEAIWIEKSERWQIKVQKDGERKAFYSPTPGKKGKVAAEKKADKWLESSVIRQNVRFDKLWAEFLEETKKTTGTPNYKKHEQIGRTWLYPVVKNRRVIAITGQQWQNCINNAFDAGRSKKTCMNVRASIVTFCKYAKKGKILKTVPDDLLIPKGAKVGQRNILQQASLKTLFSVDYVTHYNRQVPAFFVHAWRFMVLTGLRRGELCGLQPDDLTDGVLHLRRSVNEYCEITQGKNKNAQRYIVLSERAKAVLSDQEAMMKKSGIIHRKWIFPDESGQMLDPKRLYDKWRTYCTQHKLYCSLHELRHTLISVAKADVPEELLKSQVGHSKSMDTFGVYGHDIAGEGQRVADILDGIFDVLLK